MNKGRFIGRLSARPRGARPKNVVGYYGFHMFGFFGTPLKVTAYPQRIVAHAFPAAGNRNGAGLNNFGTNGYYWSSVSSSATNAYNVNFNGGNFNAQNSNNRYNGFSVRLAVASASPLVLVSLPFEGASAGIPAAGWRNGAGLSGFGT